jgi:hypothetical protein
MCRAVTTEYLVRRIPGGGFGLAGIVRSECGSCRRPGRAGNRGCRRLPARF